MLMKYQRVHQLHYLSHWVLLTHCLNHLEEIISGFTQVYNLVLNPDIRVEIARRFQRFHGINRRIVMRNYEYVRHSVQPSTSTRGHGTAAASRN